MGSPPHALLSASSILETQIIVFYLRQIASVFLKHIHTLRKLLRKSVTDDTTAPCRVNQHGGDPDLLDTTGFRLLSLHGGGVRGLSTLYILENIICRLNSCRRAADLPQVKPCEMFDLIGGTSTGG